MRTIGCRAAAARPCATCGSDMRVHDGRAGDRPTVEQPVPRLGVGERAELSRQALVGGPGDRRHDAHKRKMWVTVRGKRIKGKKRHLLVDTQGLLMHAIVHAAHVQDRDGGVWLMAVLFARYPFLLKLYADGGYQGPQ